MVLNTVSQSLDWQTLAQIIVKGSPLNLASVTRIHSGQDIPTDRIVPLFDERVKYV